MAAMAGGMMLSAATAAPDGPVWATPSEAQIREILVKRIDVEQQGVGIVVGVIDASGRRIVSYGHLAAGDARPVDGDTIFEIGSVTKAVTGLVLADMVQKGEVRLDDPVAQYLPADVVMPSTGGKQIRLIDLATHTSGLPRLPDNLAPRDINDPYADYGADQLYAALNAYRLTREIGATYNYSNLGAGLLGHVLALRAGVDYETLVAQRITGPLKMSDTTITLSSSQQARLARGHAADLTPVANWDMNVLAGAGGLRSSAQDMLTLLAAELGFADTPLASAMAAQTVPRRPLDQARGAGGGEIALGWHIQKTPTGEVVWHNGGTGGYRSFLGFDPKARVGVVVLTNVSNGPGGDDIGFHILTGSPLAEAPKQRQAMQLPTETLQAYVGRYELAPTVVLSVTLENGQMFAQLTGQERAPIFAESATGFFYKIADAQISFEVDGAGRATGLVLHQAGQSAPARRLADEAP